MGPRDPWEKERQQAIFEVLLAVIAVFLLISAIIGPRGCSEARADTIPDGYCETTCDPSCAEDWFEQPPPPPPDVVARVKLIGRLAIGIRSLATANGGGRWWECGRTLDPGEAVDTSIEWAARIVDLAGDYSDRGSRGPNAYQMNPWEIAGVVANETKFDRCILGKWPRKWGYDHGTMARSRLALSHTYDDVKRTLTDPRGATWWATVGFDASPMHLLWRCRDGMCWPKFNPEELPPIPMAEVFSLGTGFEYGVRAFKKRAITHRTSTPSLYWRGYRCEWYLEKIRNWARRLGAKKGEF